ncbi:unnamed protein product [Durusdinium trenchii]|uniref:Uncharacterized protein n=1 Tax=Durusdinium trenchii TaxID=1381693 RepID=A0ABP0IJQ7_9DINO
MSEKLTAVLARCERIQQGAETLSNLPSHLAERLQKLYSKCERLKQANSQEHSNSSIDRVDAGDEDLQRDEVALTDPYLLEEDEEAEAKRTPGLAAQEPKEQESELEEEVKEAEEGKEERDEVGDEVEQLEPLSMKRLSSIFRHQIDQSFEARARTLRTRASYISIPSLKLGFQSCQPRRSPAEASDVASAALETVQFVSCAWNNLPVNVEFVEKEVRYIVEKKLGESSGSAIYAIRSANGGGFIVKMSAENKEPFARLFREGELQKVELENVMLDIFDVSSFVQTLTQVISDFNASMSTPMLPTVPLEQSAFKVLFSGDEGTRSVEEKPGETREVATWSKAKPQAPPKSLSTMLESYVDEDSVSNVSDPNPEEPDGSDAKVEVSGPVTAEGAKARAVARMAKSQTKANTKEDEDLEEDQVHEVDVLKGPNEVGEGAFTWDPATGQFVREEIPADIAEEFRRKPLNLEDYQQRVLMAQLQDKKRRLQQQQEERDRQRQKLEKQQEQERLQAQREQQLTRVLESYAQESPPDASGPGLEHAGAQVPPLLVPHDATNVDQLTLLQSAQAAHAAQVAQAAQIQQQAFRLQVQQLAALHGVLNAARHAAHPSVQNHNWQMPGVTPGMAQHLGLASQIYSWMAGQAAFGSL